MAYPEFFDLAPKITLFDGLSQVLGASNNGLIEYSYTDAVKFAGHSCPTVAGAYLMTLVGLRHLYPGTVPERGAIKVAFHDEATEGVTGVMAGVVTLLTGATYDTGFKGLGGQHDRRNLLFFNQDIPGEMQLQREDNQRGVALSYSARAVPLDTRAIPLLQKILSNRAVEQEQILFADLWQARVKQILESYETLGLVQCTPL